MTTEMNKNVYEICGKLTASGIIDNNDNANQIRTRYSCINHYLQVYNKIKEEGGITIEE